MEFDPVVLDAMNADLEAFGASGVQHTWGVSAGDVMNASDAASGFNIANAMSDFGSDGVAYGAAENGIAFGEADFFSGIGDMLKNLGLTTADGKLSGLGAIGMTLAGGLGKEMLLDKQIKAASALQDKRTQAEFDMYNLRTANKGSVGLIDQPNVLAALQKRAASVKDGGTNTGLLATIKGA